MKPVNRYFRTLIPFALAICLMVGLAGCTSGNDDSTHNTIDISSVPTTQPESPTEDSIQPCEPTEATVPPTENTTTPPTEEVPLPTEEHPSEASPDNSIQYPLEYSDSTCSIAITKEWYEDACCYIAHLQFTDYSRFGTACANGAYGSGYETTSAAASRLDAIFAVNGCYSAVDLDYPVVRSGVLCNGSGRNLWVPAIYSSHNGLLLSAWESGGDASVTAKTLDDLVSKGLVTDTFCFGPPILANGAVCANSSTDRAQRTFMGTNGAAGDIWIVVSEGRFADGASLGLTYQQCARLLMEKGCVFGIPLDGGGSSTMVFNGQVLNSALQNQRKIVDFIYFK